MSTSEEQSTSATTTTHPLSNELRLWQGEKNPRPDVHGLYKRRLDWRALNSMRKEDREKLVIKRANFFNHCSPPSYALAGATRRWILNMQREAAETGNLGKEGFDRPGMMPLEYVCYMLSRF